MVDDRSRHAAGEDLGAVLLTLRRRWESWRPHRRKTAASRGRSAPGSGTTRPSSGSQPIGIATYSSIVPAALRMSSVWPFASAGSSDETIDAAATCGETARATTKRPVGSSRAARRAAVASAGTIAAALGSLRATKVSELVERWPKWSWRIVSARPGACFAIERRAPLRMSRPPVTRRWPSGGQSMDHPRCSGLGQRWEYRCRVAEGGRRRRARRSRRSSRAGS
jgi:hypothetical protein